MEEKIFTMYLLENESAKMESVMNDYSDKIKYWDKSKIFTVQNTRIIIYTMVTDEETFLDITKEMDGTRVY